MGKGKPRHRLGYAEPLPLPWYDRLIANLIRMRTQEHNINKIQLIDEGIEIAWIDDHILIHNKETKGIHDLDFYWQGYISTPMLFDKVQDAIEFDWETYDKERPVYMS